MAKNVMVGQSGGPTSVINSSLAGVYEASRARGAEHVYVVLAVAVLAVGPKHPSVPLIFIAVTLFGAAVTVVCAALSHLTQKAADLKNDNDLTI